MEEWVESEEDISEENEEMDQEQIDKKNKIKGKKNTFVVAIFKKLSRK